MRYQAVVRIRGKNLLRYYGSPWISPAVSGIFNRWYREYGTQWTDVRKDVPTIRLLPR